MANENDDLDPEAGEEELLSEEQIRALAEQDGNTPDPGAPEGTPTPTDPDGAPADTEQEPNPAADPGANVATAVAADAAAKLPAGAEVSLEREVTIYARITNLEGLAQATSIEEHVQIEQKSDSGTKQRVRLSVNPQTSAETIIFTTKIPVGEGMGDKEHSVPVSKDFLEVFRLGATREILKTRYRFPAQSITVQVDGEAMPVEVPGIGYEVDVFHTYGAPTEWAKIDLEIQDLFKKLAEILPNRDVFRLRLKFEKLPFAPVDAIIAGQETDEQKAQLGQLWETQFARKLAGPTPVGT